MTSIAVKGTTLQETTNSRSYILDYKFTADTFRLFRVLQSECCWHYYELCMCRLTTARCSQRSCVSSLILVVTTPEGCKTYKYMLPIIAI